MTAIRFFQVDAFSNIPFKGNPAAICLLDSPLEAETMQRIAAENNLAETAFVSARPDGFDLRWFTPTVEVDLCGHATLATAHILWEQRVIAESQEARFYTRSGLLRCTKDGDWIQLDFPKADIVEMELPAAVRDALNVHPVNSVYAKDRFIVELEGQDLVEQAKPDLKVLKDYDLVVITGKGKSSGPYDFVSRTFVPSHGVDEDQVTGSSHCGLVPYWAGRLGKTEMLAFQASERGGELKLKLAGDRVLIAGQAVTVITGTFHI